MQAKMIAESRAAATLAAAHWCVHLGPPHDLSLLFVHVFTNMLLLLLLFVVC
jgi:hypothetical protein